MTEQVPVPSPIKPLDLSYVRGETGVPLSIQTIADLLADTVFRFPDRLAVVFREQGIRWTWTQFNAQVDRFAAGLVSLGLVRGDRFGIWSPNRSEWIVAQFATARIGVILVNEVQLWAAIGLALMAGRIVTGWLLDRIWAPIVCLPILLIGMWAGGRHFLGATADGFRRVTLGLLLVLSIIGVLRAMWG